MIKLLLVEDEKRMAQALCEILRQENYQVDHFGDGCEGFLAAESGVYDLIILDVMMPELDGQEACLRIREFSNVPIIMLTARSEDADKLMGFECGADDYVTKPFNPVEVAARVRSQLRRYFQLGSGNLRPEVLALGGIQMDDREKAVTLDGDPVPLTPTEYDILKLLLEHPGQVFSPKEIYRKVWKDAPFGSENTVAVHIRHLREKLEIDPAEPRYLKVVWGQGYKMEGGKP